MDLPERHLKESTIQRRLGDYLIEAGKISPDQLDEAIEYQCIYGGRLGTSLIELGLVSEDQLAHILSQQLKLHYIKPELLMKVPNNILKLIPLKLALKYRVVPYHKDHGKLYVAISDSANLAAIDELSFQLDHIIVPLAVPEVRLMLALKKHYGMDLTPRFENLEAQIKYRKKAAAKIKQKQAAPQTVDQEQGNAWPLLGEEDDAGMPPDDDSYFTFNTNTIEKNCTSFSQHLIAATDRNDIAKSLLNHLGDKCKGCGLLVVKATTATGWLCKSNNVEQSRFTDLQIPLQEPSVFNLVIKSKSHFLGAVSDTPHNRKLLENFSCTPPQTALVIPLQVKGRLVSILYIQDSLELLEKQFTELQNAARKTEMAFALLILKNKILST